MALKSYHTEPVARPVYFFLQEMWDKDSSVMFDMTQPYQRGDVWGLKRRQNLLKSLLSGVPIPAVIVNDRFRASFQAPGYDKDRNWAYAIVDGKQRVTTLQMFARDEFGVPADWWETSDVDHVADDGLVYWSGLSKAGQGYFTRSCRLPTNEGRFTTLEEEQELFDLINFGGLAQGESDED